MSRSIWKGPFVSKSSKKFILNTQKNPSVDILNKFNEILINKQLKDFSLNNNNSSFFSIWKNSYENLQPSILSYNIKSLSDFSLSAWLRDPAPRGEGPRKAGNNKLSSPHGGAQKGWGKIISEDDFFASQLGWETPLRGAEGIRYTDFSQKLNENLSRSVGNSPIEEHTEQKSKFSETQGVYTTESEQVLLQNNNSEVWLRVANKLGVNHEYIKSLLSRSLWDLQNGNLLDPQSGSSTLQRGLWDKVLNISKDFLKNEHNLLRLNKQNTYILLPYRDSRRGPSASYCGTAFCRPTLKAGSLSLAETPQWWSELLGHAEDIHGGSTAQRDIKLLKISFENLFFNFIFLNIKENKIFGFHSLFPAIQDTAPFSKTPQCGVASTSLHFSGETPLSAMLRDPAPRGTKSEPAWQRGLWDVQTDGQSAPPQSGESENRRKVRLSRYKVNIKRYREFIEDDLFNIKLFFKYRSSIVLNFLGSDVDGITPLLSWHNSLKRGAWSERFLGPQLYRELQQSLSMLKIIQLFKWWSFFDDKTINKFSQTLNVANALKFLDQVRVLYKTEPKSLHRRAAIKESKRSVESDKVEKNTQKIRSSILERKASKSDQSFPLKDPRSGSLRDNKNNKAVLRDLQDPLRGPSAPTMSEQRGLRDNNFESTRECIFVSRSSIITPNMVGLHVFIHDGKEWKILNIKNHHVGYKAGSFVMTKKVALFKKGLNNAKRSSKLRSV